MMLEGKVAIVTGGGSGLGAEIAKRFVEEGARVVVVGRRQRNLEDVIASMPEGSAIMCAGDVTQAETRQRVIDAALSFGAGLHVLVNNAGVADAAAPLAEFSEEGWNAAIAINLTAPLALMQLAIPHMIEAGGGSIVNVSSLAALAAIPGSVGYCATKRALLAVTEVAAVDYGDQGIRCNAICPGSFLTDMARHGLEDLSGGGDPEEARRYFTAPVPQRRLADPREITGLVAFLASDDSSFVNGATIPIDGGAHVVDQQAFSISLLKR